VKSFNARLSEHISAIGSHLCVGLDINPEALQMNYSTLDDLKAHTRKVIEATAGLAAVYKPNLAFFERWGSAGIEWLEETMEWIGDSALTIGDAKRGDIGNTARQYAASLFEYFGFDAVTVNPYMGRDAIEPFTQASEKGVFVLCRTSNASAGDIQDNEINGERIFESVARLVSKLNSNDNLGLVVGSTSAAEIAGIRELAPGLPFLIPGIGVQGGDLETSFRSGNTNGIAVINVSRSIIFAGNQGFKDIRAEAQRYVEIMRDLK
jgi:orotidine-5'-phosphate decarboxylase